MINKIKNKIKNSEKLYRYAIILKNQKHIFKPKGKISHKNIRGGKNNKILYNQTVELSNVKIDIYGGNNTIIIEDFCRFFNVTFYIKGNNNEIRIGKGVRFKRGGELWIQDYNCKIDIKAGSTFVNAHIAAIEHNSKITIGENCVFGANVDVRTGDSHSIIDTKTNERYNHAKDISIGDHVWVTSQCTILKGSNIAKYSVVSTGSVVTKPFTKEGIIIGGNPAIMIKENINWEKRVVIYGE